MKLQATKITGENRFTNGYFDPTDQYGEGVIDVRFVNQGVNSTVTIKLGDVDVVLPPGTNRSGASIGIGLPYGYKDTTKYIYSFTNAGGAATQINHLVILITKVIPE